MKSMLATIALVATVPAAATPLPAAIAGQLPAGYEVIARARVVAGQPMRRFEILALVRHDERTLRQTSPNAPARPLLIFEQKGQRFVPAGRNDRVIMKADAGGQCDPFLDGDAKIAVKGRYFTVENGVACGQHWTDYVTFRLDDHAGGFVFDNERREAWELNPSNDPSAEALVLAEPARVIRPHKGKVTPFAAWRSRR